MARAGKRTSPAFITRWMFGFVAMALACCMAAGAAFARDADAIRVRYGLHQGFVRIVFDWPERTPYKLDLRPEGATIRFSAKNSFDLKRVKGRKRLDVRSKAPGAVEMTYAGASSIHHFLHGNHVVVDLLEGNAGEPLPKQLAVKPPVSVKAMQPASPSPVLSPTLAPKPSAPQKAEAREAKDKPTRVAASSLGADEMQQMTASKTAPPAKPPGAAPMAPPDIASIIPDALSGISPKPVPPGAERKVLSVRARDGAMVMDLPVGQIPAAAFSRANGHWILFDEPFAIDLARAIKAGIDVVQLPFVDKTVLHMRTDNTAMLTAEPTKTGWRFRLGDKLDHITEPALVRRAFDPPIGPRLMVDNLRGGRLMRVADPEVGDALFVVAVQAPMRVALGYETPDAELPPTALGIVVAPRREGVGARLRLGSLVIRRKGGLKLSQPEALVESAPIQTSRIDPVAWRGKEKDFGKGKRNLMAKMNGVPTVARKPARIDLARYYLANGYAAEAVGMIEFTAGGKAEVKDNLDFLAIRGIARAMLSQYDKAEIDLAGGAFNGDAQVEIWRAMGLSAAGKHRFAAAKFRQFWPAASMWPLKQQVQLAAMAGESALAAGLPRLAQEFAQGLSISTKSAEDGAALTLVQAGVYAAEGRPDKASTAYMTAKKHGDLGVRARAELGLIKLDFDRGAIDADAAADRLARLQMQWRGDRTEYDTLKTLGELRLANSNYREGFEALSEAARVFARRFDTSDVVASMAAGFEQAFVRGGADALPAIEAVALYKDFEELAPPGHKGDLALAALSRRLSALDLLDEADKILDHLVRRRVDGALLAELGCALAEIRVDRRGWKGALSALDESERGEAEASDAIMNRRLNVRARALAGSGQTKAALALLSDATTIDRLRLKANFAWQSGDWVAVRDAYRGLSKQGVFEAKADGAKAQTEQSAMALRWAVAAAMLGADEELSMIANRFKNKAGAPKLNAALAMLTTPTKPRGEAIAAARAAISAVDRVTNTIGAYQAAQAKAG